MVKKLLFLLLAFACLIISKTSNAQLGGTYRNQALAGGTHRDTLIFEGTHYDSLGLKPEDGDSILYVRTFGTTTVDSTRVAFATDKWGATGKFRHIFRASNSSGSAGTYLIHVEAWKNGTWPGTRGWAWDGYYNVESDAAYDTTASLAANADKTGYGLSAAERDSLYRLIPSPFNLATNGSFEEGTRHWVLAGTTTPTVASFAWGDPRIADGRYAINLFGGATQGSATSDTISLLVGDALTYGGRLTYDKISSQAGIQLGTISLRSTAGTLYDSLSIASASGAAGRTAATGRLHTIRVGIAGNTGTNIPAGKYFLKLEILGTTTGATDTASFDGVFATLGKASILAVDTSSNVTTATTVTTVTNRVTANADQWAGGTIPAPRTAGTPLVDMDLWKGDNARRAMGISGADTLLHIGLHNWRGTLARAQSADPITGFLYPSMTVEAWAIEGNTASGTTPTSLNGSGFVRGEVRTWGTGGNTVNALQSGRVDAYIGFIAPAQMDSLAWMLTGGAQNMLPDPGFEARPLGGVNSVWSQVTATAAIRQNGYIPAGRKCLALSGANAKAVSDSFYVLIGDRFIFGGMMLSKSILNGNTIQIETPAGTQKASVTVPTNAGNDLWFGVLGYWQVAATGYFRMGIVNGSNAADTMRVDNMYLYSAPDSVSLAALSIAAVADSVDNHGMKLTQLERDSLAMRIRDSVWLTNFAQLLARKDAGDVIDSAKGWGAGGSGGGGGCTFGTTYTDTVYARNTTTSSQIPNAVIVVKNLSGTDLGKFQTGSNGKYIGTFDASTYLLYPNLLSGIAWTDNPDTFIVTGNGQNDTIRGTTITFPSPPPGGQITVSGNIADVAGGNIPGAVVVFNLERPAFWSTADTTNMKIVMLHPSVATADSAGNWSSVLYPTTKLQSSDRRYPARYACSIYGPDGITLIMSTAFVITFDDLTCCQAFQPGLYKWHIE